MAAVIHRSRVIQRPAGAIMRPVVRTSTLEIQQSTGKANIYKTSWVVIGFPKVGKSTLCSGFEDCLYLCTSEKEVGSLIVPYLLIDSWERMLAVVDELINNRVAYPYKFLVVDFIDMIWTFCEIAVCEKLGVDHTTDAKYGKGSGMVKTFFRLLITKLVASGYGMLFVSHINQKEVITDSGVATKVVCSLPENARMILFPLVNVIGCMAYKTMTVSVNGKPQIVRKRVIKFEGDEYVEAGDRDGVLPKEVVLLNDPKANFEIFRDYYEGRRVK